MSAEQKTLRGQVLHQGQDAIGRLAQDLIKVPAVSGVLSTVFEARERAVRAQEVAMGAMGLPSAADIERLTRRLRSVSQRLEGLEDGIDRIVERLDKRAAEVGLDQRLSNLEAALKRIEATLAASGSLGDPRNSSPAAGSTSPDSASASASPDSPAASPSPDSPAAGTGSPPDAG